MVHFRNFVLGFTFFTVRLSTAVWTPVERQSQLIGSSQPIVVALGDDIILPCCVEPRRNVEDLTMEWWREDLPFMNKYVHRYHDNHDVEDRKMSSYAGRTTLFKDELKHGNASLKILNVKLADQGSYRCVIPQLGTATIIRIVVDPDSVKTWTTETPVLPRSLQTPDPKEETDVKGGRSHQGVWIPAVVFCILLVLGVCGGVAGYVIKHKPQKLNRQSMTSPQKSHFQSRCLAQELVGI
ncbi:selection and upkeep of intraepithelial T-cells protein 1-like isoform X2 [Micropterus salmoides]|uniref:selection and upkeep of intraepithelial T-cells protein 1-like isoform X2 n=1 Tax=Micropterus salmoides TaxID=27706 RepID=UPI0018EAE810|nr:selection and upkeep of intraepithelial T-cells protein 1-like isoform X2 [Micropterus salmoides]